MDDCITPLFMVTEAHTRLIRTLNSTLSDEPDSEQLHKNEKNFLNGNIFFAKSSKDEGKYKTCERMNAEKFLIRAGVM